MDVIITTKVPQLKLVRIIDILKGNVLSLIIMADKILLKLLRLLLETALYIYLKL